MNHLCLIIDNSLTLDQKPINNLTLLDFVKNSIESSFRNLSRIGFPNQNQYIHLFVTSHPESPLSSFQHDESHLSFQLKSIKTSMDTDPALTIQNAINHISRFRILTQAQTFKGYREAFIYEPALIIFFTDRMTKHKIQKLSNAIDQGRIQMRSEYQFLSYILCQPSIMQRNLLTEQSFKTLVQSQVKNGFAQTIRKLNGEVKYSMHYQNLTNSLCNRIQHFKPFLFFNFTLKEMKKKNNGFVQSERGGDYFNAWRNFLSSVPFQLVPTKLWKIPLPFETKLSEENGNIKVQKMGQLQFYLDLTKKFTENLSNMMPQNRYKVFQNPFTSQLQNEKLQEMYPIFFQHKNTEILIGLLQISHKNTEIVFFFPNFTNLNLIMKNIQMQQNQKMIQSTIYHYMVPLPTFYLKFLKLLFDKLHLEVNYEAFQSSASNSLNLKLQNALQTTRSSQRKNMAKLYQNNLQLHQNYKSECCYIYSQKYEQAAKMLSQYPRNHNETQGFFDNLLDQLIDFKIKFGIDDYIASTRVVSNPVLKQLQKYNTIAKRTGDEDFNQNISINLGNPYKKKRKTNENQAKENYSHIRKQDLAMRFADQSRFPVEDNDKAQVKKVNKTQVEPKSIIVAKDTHSAQEKLSQKTQQNEVIMKSKERKNSQKSLKKKEKIKQSFSKECETVRRINSLTKQKEMEVSFNQKNLFTSKMLKNQSILQNFLQKFKKK